MTRHFLQLLSLGLALTLSSCAYMQVHKNVEEQGRSVAGHKLETPSQVYQQGGQWYLAALPAEFRLHHPAVHDSVLQKQTQKEMRLIGEPGAQPAYHRISAGTAKVLMRTDGYADLVSLADELRTEPGGWLTTLPGARAYPIHAQLVGEPVSITPVAEPAELSLGTKALSSLVLLLVDVPGTIVYNIGIPFAAPVIYFRDFMKED